MFVVAKLDGLVPNVPMISTSVNIQIFITVRKTRHVAIQKARTIVKSSKVKGGVAERTRQLAFRINRRA